FQPLVIPGSQGAGESSSAANNGLNLNLPDIQLLMHQINLNAQFEWEIFSRFAAGAVSRLSLNWYDMNPDLSGDPMRAFYPDLQYSKTEVKKTHIGVGAGLNIAYDIGCKWSIHTRGLFNKNFVGLNANTAIIKNQFWTYETGLRYRF
ncbi:MAG: hypothetical protein GVX96_01555, partial [Bacteroidetes bacterium]|nr:hypothetical protein [Bacteroidota bacterium]